LFALVALLIVSIAPALVSGPSSASHPLPLHQLNFLLIPDYLISSRKFTLLALIVLAVSLNFIVGNGIDYVSHPKLVVIDDVLNYNGKGFESGRRGRPVKLVSVEGAAKSRTARKESSVLPLLNSQTAKQD
jgi:hypothetical protein